MKAQKAKIISFHCVLRDPLGRVISSSFNHDVLTDVLDAPSSQDKAAVPKHAPARKAVFAGHSDFHEPLRGLVEGLQDLKKGEKRKIFVSADRAYGYYDPSLVMEVPRSKLPHGGALEVGFQVVTQAEDGEARVFRIVAADARTVTLDGNHPLAGQDLCFDIEATAAREATPEEIERARSGERAPTDSLH